MKKEKGLQYGEFLKGSKGKPDCYHMYNQVYEMNFYLVIGQKEKCYNTFKALENHTLKEGCMFTNSDAQPVLWIKEKGILDTFVHECDHVVNYVMRQIGAHPDYENDEPHAYLLSWLFRGFYFAVCQKPKNK